MNNMPLLKPGQPQAPEREHPTIGYYQPLRNLQGTGRGKFLKGI